MGVCVYGICGIAVGLFLCYARCFLTAPRYSMRMHSYNTVQVHVQGYTCTRAYAHLLYICAYVNVGVHSCMQECEIGTWREYTVYMCTHVCRSTLYSTLCMCIRACVYVHVYTCMCIRGSRSTQVAHGGSMRVLVRCQRCR